MRSQAGAARSREHPSKPRFNIRKLQNYGLPVFIILLALAAGLIESRFWSHSNLLNLCRQIAPLLIISVGQSLAIISGGLDLSLAAVLALSGVAGVIVMNEAGVIAGLVAMIAIGGVFGMLNGLIISRFKVSPLIVTLGMLSVCKGIAMMASGGLPIYEMPDVYLDILGYGTLFGIPSSIIVAAFLVFLTAMLLGHTKFGRYVYAIGSNQEAAFSSGINVRRNITLVYCLSGMTAGVGAIVLTAWVNAAQPAAAEGLELTSIAAVVLGGVALTGGSGRMRNVVYGAIILGMLTNALNMIGVSSFMQTLVIGVVIIVAVILDKMRQERT